MARATLEMFLKLTGADKTSKGLDKTSNAAKNLDDNVKNSAKANAKFSAGMSSLTKGAIAGAALFAGKALVDFAADALEAAVSAEEAAAAFETTFGEAVVGVTKFTEEFANKAGLTTSELQQLLATTGSVAQGIGFTQEESADLGETLTRVAADVASFSNIQGGAEPVLRAFQSALLGENEALKTYGLAISAAEVETKAFEMTGKSTSNSLTRQEKALATLAVIQEKAAVQIGDLDRTSESFANQQRLVQAEVRQLSEDIGAELIPAAAEILPIFRELVNDIAPPTIEFFKTAAKFVADLSLAFDNLAIKAEAVSNKFPRLSANGERFLNFLKRISPVFAFIRSIENLAEEQRKYNIITDDTAEKLIAQQIAQGLANKETEKARQTTLKQTRQLDIYTTKLTKGTLPAIEKYLKFVSLLNKDNDESITLNDELAIAQDNLTEAQRKEALSTAEEALQKKELQNQIAELLFFQRQGVDVTEELAVAQEQLKLVEFELTRESEALRDAKKEVNDIEAQLEVTIDKTNKKFDDQLDAYLGLNEQVGIFKELAIDKKFMEILAAAGLTNPFLATGLDLLSQLAQLEGLDNRARELERFAAAAERLANAPDVPIQAISAPVSATVPRFGQQELAAFQSAGFQGGQQNLEIVLNIDENEIQRVNTAIQQRGKQFILTDF
tara:strand:- start:1261 stop:3279 length:2019 start_codon:yes stop_codon:yes gene_type:complete